MSLCPCTALIMATAYHRGTECAEGFVPKCIKAELVNFNVFECKSVSNGCVFLCIFWFKPKIKTI